jgi:HSP20 family molecular chaperone IbpA
MARSKDSASDMDGAGMDEMTELPALRDSMSEEEKAAALDSDMNGSPPGQPMLADEKHAADMRNAFEEENRKLEETRKRSEEFRRQAESPNVDALKLFLVIPGDMNEPPFHFHNTPDQVVVVAETPGYAARLASATHGPVWEDDSKVRVREVKFKGPQVLDAAAWRTIAGQLLADRSQS